MPTWSTTIEFILELLPAITLIFIALPSLWVLYLLDKVKPSKFNYMFF